MTRESKHQVPATKRKISLFPAVDRPPLREEKKKKKKEKKPFIRRENDAYVMS